MRRVFCGVAVVFFVLPSVAVVGENPFSAPDTEITVRMNGVPPRRSQPFSSASPSSVPVPSSAPIRPDPYGPTAPESKPSASLIVVKPNPAIDYRLRVVAPAADVDHRLTIIEPFSTRAVTFRGASEGR